MSYLMIKRMMDVFVAGSVLALAGIPLLGVAAVVRWKMGSPVLFRQTRIGLGGKPFELIKFRTMKDSSDASGKLLSDAERLTSFGAFLRATSLDELPELLNVIKGDMSLVGPRPLLPEYMPYYSPRQAKRHDVRPGLTGLAQIRGRNAVSWDERLETDVEYVEQISFGADVSIILKTVWAVFSRSGISAEGHATMPRFDEEMKKRRAEKNRC